MTYGITWNLQLNVREGRLSAGKDLMQEMITSTRQESGATLYEWFFNADGTRCHIREGYTGSQAALIHLGTFGSQFMERFLGCFEPTSLSVYGSPTQELRNVLDGFGAKYLVFGDGFRA